MLNKNSTILIRIIHNNLWDLEVNGPQQLAKESRRGSTAQVTLSEFKHPLSTYYYEILGKLNYLCLIFSPTSQRDISNGHVNIIATIMINLVLTIKLYKCYIRILAEHSLNLQLSLIYIADIQEEVFWLLGATNNSESPCGAKDQVEDQDENKEHNLSEE